VPPIILCRPLQDYGGAAKPSAPFIAERKFDGAMRLLRRATGAFECCITPDDASLL
jgi:hypothetical protein